MLSHPFAPVFDEHSEILILGSFPSVKSRENEFYYGHPQNRFWKVLEAVFESNNEVSVTNIAISENYDAPAETPATGNNTFASYNIASAHDSEVSTAGNSSYVQNKSSHEQDNALYTRIRTFSATPLPRATIAEKKTFLLQHRIALWDVIATCDIKGSADATITNATPNDIAGLLKKAPIRKICCNGNKAWELFQKYILSTLEGQTDITENVPTVADISAQAGISSQNEDISSHTGKSKIEITKLPSTSPANAAWSLEKLIASWKKELSGAAH